MTEFVPSPHKLRDLTRGAILYDLRSDEANGTSDPWLA
jgi:hypothetical protein